METRGMVNSPSWNAARPEMPLVSVANDVVLTVSRAPGAGAGGVKNGESAYPAAGAGIILMVAEASKQKM